MTHISVATLFVAVIEGLLWSPAPVEPTPVVPEALVLTETVVPAVPVGADVEASWDLTEIRSEGVIRVALPASTASWYLDEGDLQGFEVELLQRIADDLGVQLRVRRLDDDSDACAWLRWGQVDVLAGAPPRCTGRHIPMDQRTPLVLRRAAPDLATTLDGWLADHDSLLRILAAQHPEVPPTSGVGEQVSRFDQLFREGAETLGWDWRLIAAQAYQESRFEADAQSVAGANGLMQLMPETAARFGVDDPNDPRQSVAGAVRALEALEVRFAGRVADDDLLAFVLAGYNGGPGHVEDAMRLAAAQGDDPSRWVDVRLWLARKGDPRWYRDPVVEHGYCRGSEPVAYVDAILSRYAHYRQLLPT